jgi:thiol-disulfide isomerase/thioredoxin
MKKAYLKIFTLIWILQASYVNKSSGQSNLHISVKGPVSITFNSAQLDNGSDFRIGLMDHLLEGVENRDKPDESNWVNFKNKIVNHSVSFFIKRLIEPQYAAFGYSSKDFIIDYSVFLEPGDSVVVAIKNGQLFFTGRNAPKYNCRSELWKLRKDNGVLLNESPKDTTKVFEYFKKIDSIGILGLNILHNFKKHLTARQYSILKAELISTYEGIKTRYILGQMGYGYNNYTLNNSRKYVYILKSYQDPIWNPTVKLDFLHNIYIQHWCFVTGFLTDQYVYDNCFIGQADFSFTDCYQFFKNNFKGKSRESILYTLLNDFRIWTRSPFRKELISCINDAVDSGYIQTSSLRSDLLNLIPSISVGEEAFNFNLPDTTGKMINLSDFKGKVVLLDMWFFGCGNCAEVHPLLDSIGKLYNKKDFELISVCIDPLPSHKEKWLHANSERDKYTSNENINLWSLDLKEKPAEIVKYYHINAAPAYILIDKNGKLMDQITDPRLDAGKDLIKKINNGLSSD